MAGAAQQQAVEEQAQLILRARWAGSMQLGMAGGSTPCACFGCLLATCATPSPPPPLNSITALAGTYGSCLAAIAKAAGAMPPDQAAFAASKALQVGWVAAASAGLS